MISSWFAEEGAEHTKLNRREVVVVVAARFLTVYESSAILIMNRTLFNNSARCTAGSVSHLHFVNADTWSVSTQIQKKSFDYNYKKET